MTITSKNERASQPDVQATGVELQTGAVNTKTNSILTNEDVYLKMIGVWQIYKIAGLSAKMTGNNVQFTFIYKGKEMPIITMPSSLFLQLAPIEIRDVIERSITNSYKIDGSLFRSDLKGFTKDPFSSQN